MSKKLNKIFIEKYGEEAFEELFCCIYDGDTDRFKLLSKNKLNELNYWGLILMDGKIIISYEDGSFTGSVIDQFDVDLWAIKDEIKKSDFRMIRINKCLGV